MKLTLAIVLLLFQIQLIGLKKLKTNCQTKYPILLVHGVAFRDDVRVLPYWSRLPRVLEKQGAQVFLAHQNAFDSHVNNALFIRQRVFEILDETGAEKINIIAHSKGGIEARYMISELGMDKYVASLTTLATPHRGSSLADSLMDFFERKDLLKVAEKYIGKYAYLIGDRESDILAAGYQLTNTYMQNFNQSVLDMESVYYQSYGGVVNDPTEFLLRFQWEIVAKGEGENDGIVALNSYKWGNFRGIVTADDDLGISHFDIAGMRFVSKATTFDAKSFFVEIVEDLKNRGF